MKVAVPWLQHSQRFGHWALSQTVCKRKSEMSAFVEKKTEFDGSRTLIQGGFCARCNAGSTFAQDIEQSYKVKKVTKVKSLCVEALQRLACHVERSETSLIYHFQALSKKTIRDSSTSLGMTCL
jgi:hypothetical protein